MSAEVLKRFSNQKSKYFEIKDGEEVPVMFLRAEEVANKFKGGNGTLIRYHLEENGSKKMWDRGSRSLAEQMSEIKDGTAIIIKRVGKEQDTKYFVKEINI